MKVLRRSEPLWHSLPGCLAAYQPVGAPGPDITRYNQSNGGTNVYRATDGVAPTWTAAQGWIFNGLTQYMTTGIIPGASRDFTIVGAWADMLFLAGGRCMIGGVAENPWPELALKPCYTTAINIRYSNGGSTTTNSSSAAGVAAVAGTQGYYSGLADGAAIGVTAGNIPAIHIGARNRWGGVDEYYKGDIHALAIYYNTLSAAEVWRISYQMKYCDTNPDWSVWSRRHEWYFVKGAGGALTLQAVAGSMTNTGVIIKQTSKQLSGNITV